MVIFLSSSIILLSLVIVGSLYFRHIKGGGKVDPRVRFATVIFVCEALLVACEMCAGGEVIQRLIFDMLLCIIGLSVVTSSIWDNQWIRWISCAVISVLLIRSVCLVLSGFGIVSLMSAQGVKVGLVVATTLFILLQCFSIWWRIRDIRAVMKMGTVWQNLSLSVDCFYVLMVIADVMMYLILNSLFPHTGWYYLAVSFMLAAATFAYGFRVLNESLFVLLSRHEMTIIESMKISNVEVANDMTKEDDPFREIYERVLAYFDNSMPYLNSELTISDVGKEVFSNKLYVSRAISQFTGRNFCQFVNYYRVTYSISLFRKNPDLNVTELANASGFNTVASFGTAFKLFMNENPSDWCRRERVQLIKGKNKLWNP